MVVITFLLRRRPELSADEFHRYWREQHGPLVREPRRGARHPRATSSCHTTDSALGAAIAASRDCEPTDYDGIAILWFDSEDALVAAASTPGGVSGSAALLEDERTFLDLPRCQLWISEDHTVIG